MFECAVWFKKCPGFFHSYRYYLTGRHVFKALYIGCLCMVLCLSHDGRWAECLSIDLFLLDNIFIYIKKRDIAKLMRSLAKLLLRLCLYMIAHSQ